MPNRVQYQSETGPITLFPAYAPKHAWAPSYPDIVPYVIVLSTAAISASGVCHNEEFFQAYQPGRAGNAPSSVRARYQYTSELGPVFIPVDAPKHAWYPNFPDVVPYAFVLPVACVSASGEFGNPEFLPAANLPRPLVWAPDFPDFARGPVPVPQHPDWEFGFPPNQLPLNPAFMAWQPEYPDFAIGCPPLRQQDWLEGASFFDAVRPPANPYGVAVYINGIDRYSYVFMSSDNIDDFLNEQPNTFRFRFDALQTGLVINGGEDIIVEIGTNLRVGSPTRIFRGNVTESEQTALGDNAANISFNVTCSDSYLINKYKPIKRYTAMDPGLIMKDLIANFTGGLYTSVYVATGFAAVSIDFDGSDDFMTCATQLANLAGCYCFPTYYRDFAFFNTYPFTAPLPINDANALLETGVRNLRFLKSNSQVRTRIIVLGASTSVDLGITSANTPYQLPAGSTIIPLSSQVPFNSAGGHARFPAQDVTYTGISSAAAKSTLSAGIPQSPGTISAATQITTPTAGPSGNLIGPSGNMQAGTYRYKVVLVDVNGEESDGSGTSVTGIISSVTPPSSLSATQASGLSGNLLGFYLYVVSFRTSNGSTLTGASTGISVGGVAAPTNNMLAAWSGAAGNLGFGTWYYKVTFKTSNGETEALGGPISGFIGQVSSTAASYGYSLSVSGGAAANFGVNSSGTYIYDVRFQDAAGETGGYVQSLTAFGYDTATVSVGASGDARVTRINVYRWIDFVGTAKFVGSLGPTGGTIIDKFAQSVLVTSPFNINGVNTTGTGKMNVTNIPVSSDARVLKRAIYRGSTGGGPFYHVVDIGDNTTTSWLDDNGTPDLVVAPTVSTANNGQVQLTNIPVSSDPRVVGRDIWRTVQGGGGGFLHCLAIGNNTFTAALDNVADVDLGASDPPLVTVGTADNGVMRLTGIPLGPTTLVPFNGVMTPITQSRRIYRTLAGGTDYRFAFSIGDNSTTTILDDTNDSSLGVAMPVASTWRTRAGAIQLPLEGITQINETAGWVRVGSQSVSYTGQSGAYLTGIPASGLGSLAADVTFETQVVGLPFLKGVTGLIYVLNHGDSTSLKVTRDDLAAQAILAASESGDGVHEEVVNDSTISTDAAAAIRGDAELILFALQMKGVEYETRDINTHSGAQAVVAVTNRNINVSLQIQHVNISRMTNDTGMYPLMKVSAAPTKYTLQDLIRQLTIGG